MQLSYVYIMASKKDGVLYTGVTSNLAARVAQHKAEALKGFTSRYFVKRLVYYEVFSEIELAIQREKNIKAWKRAWKIAAIEKTNTDWNDLFAEIVG